MQASFKATLFAFAVTAAVLAPHKSHATETGMSRTSYPQAALQTTAVNHAHVNLAPLLVKGLGLSFERVVTPAVTVGAFGTYINFESKSEHSIDYIRDTTQIAIYGARAHYFFAGAADVSSFYGGLGLAQAQMKMQRSFVADSNGEGQGKLFGPTADLGWQGTGPILGSNAKILYHLALVYGPGYAFSSSTSYSSITGQTDVAVNVKSAFFIDGSVGVAF